MLVISRRKMARFSGAGSWFVSDRELGSAGNRFWFKSFPQVVGFSEETVSGPNSVSANLKPGDQLIW